jgi:hypothetical protein
MLLSGLQPGNLTTILASIHTALRNLNMAIFKLLGQYGQTVLHLLIRKKVDAQIA